MKFSHRNLEAIRQNPKNFKQILNSSGGRISMARYWQFAARRYHQSSNDDELAVNYLENNCLNHFVNNASNSGKIRKLIDKLHLYFEDYKKQNIEFYDYTNRISIDIQNNNFITGEIFRIDKKNDGGYKIALFSKLDSIWANELRFPLLQIYYSNLFECPTMDIEVGVYNLEKDKHEYLFFDEETLQQAWNEITQISTTLINSI